MFSAVFCVATAVLGVDVGWEPGAKGEVEYIIQISPEMIEGMLRGRPIRFDLRPEHRGVRHFRFQVGKQELPRIGDPAPAPPENRIETAAKEPGPGAAELSGPELAREPPVELPPLKLPDLSIGVRAESPSDTSTGLAPQGLPANLKARPIQERQAGFNEPARSKAPQSPGGAKPAATEALLMPLVIASSTAAGLLAALLYLGWIHLGTRRRYHALLADYCSAVGRLPGCKPAEAAELSSAD